MLAALCLSSQKSTTVTRGYIVPEALHHRVAAIAYPGREQLVASDTS